MKPIDPWERWAEPVNILVAIGVAILAARIAVPLLLHWAGW